MLTPSYLLHATEPAEEIAESLHKDIMDRIIERIMIRVQNGDDYILTAVDKWQIETLQEAGFLLEDIQKEIAKATGYMQTEIAEAMEDAGVTALEYDDAIYKAAGLNPVPLTQSPYMIQLMQRDFEATLGEWTNFTRTTATACQQSFIRACDNAYNLAMSGAVSPSQAVREALETLISDGVYVEYPSGHRDTIETATARAVQTGISQGSAHIQLARMKEMGVDLVLVSSHLGARPSHAEWQGKIYHVDFATSQFFGNQIVGVSRSENTSGYPDFVTSTGYGTVTGLCGAKCRHNFGPYFEGMTNPFKEYDSEENRKQYEIEQRQRTLERRIRDTKRQTMNWKTSMDGATDNAQREEFEAKYQRKAALLQKQNAAYNDFCKDNNLKKRSDRISIAKWDRHQAAKARAAAKKWNNKPDGMARLPKKQIDKSAKTDRIKTEDINRIDMEEGKSVQRVISNVLRTEKENINLDGLPVQSQRYVLSATRKVTERFPQLKEHTKKIVYNPTIDATARSASLAGTIEIGPDFMDLEKLQKDHSYGVKLKFHPKGTEDLTSLVVHEYGHQLDGYLTLKGVYGGSVSQYGTVRTSVAVQKEVLRRAGLSDERLREIRQEWAERGYAGKDLSYAVRWERKEFITDHLSEYATENSNEFFAECFMEYMSSDEPREVAKIFGEVLTEIMEGL